MKSNNIISDKINIIVTAVMLGILLIFLCATVLCLGEKVKSELVSSKEFSSNTANVINWVEEYPFKTSKQVIADSSEQSLLNGVETKFSTIKNKLTIFENYIQENLYFKKELVNAMNRLEAGIGWETDCVTAYNPVFRLEDNYLVKIQTIIGKQKRHLWQQDI